MTEQNYRVRHRVNFSVSVKGIVTPDVTAELVDSTKEETLKEAEELLNKALEIAREKSSGSFSMK